MTGLLLVIEQQHVSGFDRTLFINLNRQITVLSFYLQYLPGHFESFVADIGIELLDLHPVKSVGVVIVFACGFQLWLHMWDHRHLQSVALARQGCQIDLAVRVVHNLLVEGHRIAFVNVDVVAFWNFGHGLLVGHDVYH